MSTAISLGLADDASILIDNDTKVGQATVDEDVVGALTLLAPGDTFDLSLSADSEAIGLSMTEGMVIISGSDYYTGDTEVTPSDETQTLSTLGKIMSADITINPIPSNYGKITWNGSTLTVS